MDQTEKRTTAAIESLRPSEHYPRPLPQPDINTLEVIRSTRSVPSVVILDDGQRDTIVFGISRWLAAQQLRMDRVEVLYRKLTENQVKELIQLELIEVGELKTENPIRLAKRFARQLDELKKRNNGRYSIARFAHVTGNGRTTISQTLKLLELEFSVQQVIKDGSLSLGTAKPLLGLPKERQASAANTIIERGYSVRQAEDFVRSLKRGVVDKPGHAEKDPNIRSLELALGEKIGCQCELSDGKLIIDYNGSNDQLEGVLNHLGYQSW